MRAKIIGHMNLPNIFDSNSIYFKYQKSIRLYKNGKLDNALSTLNDLNDEIESIYFTELIAQIYFEKKQYNKSLEFINKAIAYNNKESQFSILKAMILLEMEGLENIEESINILNSHALDLNQNAQIYWYLSQAYFKIKNIGMADLNIAKYYITTNQNDRAINFAERAKNNLTIYSNEWIQADDISKTMN
jgi:predicted Zn-dependent protease